MRKQYDFSKGVRGPYPEAIRKLRARRKPVSGPDDDDDGLTKAQIREIERRVADSRDPTRYLLVSTIGHRWALYYNVSNDVYAMNAPQLATLFKRRAAAQAIAAVLDGQVRIRKCTTRRVKGELVPVLAPVAGRRKRPRSK